MKLSNSSDVPVYTISGSSTARPLPEWLVRKRKRSLKKDPDFASRIELLQDFEFEEESCCIRISDDGEWIVSTGTYKPQIHVHHLPQLALSFARHTPSLNQTFTLLSSDYSKSLHLQTDRSIEFHTPSGCHYSTRIPRYGRDLIYDKHSAEALVPSVGIGPNSLGEVYRLNLELGRFMKSYEVDIGGEDVESLGSGALQGGVNVGAINTAAIAEKSHNLLGFGTSLGTVEFWDSRSRSRVGILQQPAPTYESRSEITALEFHSSGLNIAVGSSIGLIHLYDLRSPVPLLKKDQGYGYPIHTLTFLESSQSVPQMSTEPKILSSDKRIIKIWNSRTGDPWTSMEPAVDLHNVEWCKDSGMLLTSNQGRQQHTFFIPQLGPAPKWCSFLDNLVEEMAEDATDPQNFASHKPGEVYDNYKFVAIPELKALNLDHLIGTTGLLRPYMHGYFVAQNLYEEARLISQPELWEERRQRSIQEKINKERESRIRGNKKVSVKVNRRLAERALEREEKNERRKAKRAIEKGLQAAAAPDASSESQIEGVENGTAISQPTERKVSGSGGGLLNDARFAQLFQDEDFIVDEQSHEFKSLNPVAPSDPSRRLTAVEAEEMDNNPHNSSSDNDDDDDDASTSDDEVSRRRQQQRQRGPSDGYIEGHDSSNRISSASYRKAGHKPQERQRVHMQISSSTARPQKIRRDRSFGTRVATLRDDGQRNRAPRFGRRDEVGEKMITFTPSVSIQNHQQRQASAPDENGRSSERKETRRKDRRSASGNTFRRM